MESKIVTTEYRENIDWGEPQLVYAGKGDKIKVVMSCGVHYEDDFTGQVLYNKMDHHPIGYISECWDKDVFKPFKGQITITS